MRDNDNPCTTTRIQAPSLKLADRAAYSPAEFAGLFGKHPCWAYRQLYAGKVQAVTGLGRILIPVGEVERILAPAASYNPKPKAKLRKIRAIAGKDVEQR